MTTFRGPAAETELGIGAQTLGGLLTETAGRYADREAIAFCPPGSAPERVSYADLDATATAIGRGLLAWGVSKGSRVGLLLPNRPEWIAFAFAAARIGAVLVPMSTLARGEELDHLLRHSDVALVVTDNGFRRPYVDEVRELCPELVDAEPGALFSARYPYLRRVVDLSATRRSGAVQPWADLLDAGARVEPALVSAAAEQVLPADDAIVIYTSGTTALPKGVLHAHRGPAMQMWRFGAREGLRPDDRVYSAFPFFWTAGLAMVMGATLVSGGCLILQEIFDAGEALRLIETERVTVVHAWPHQVNQIRDHPDAATRDLSSLRLDPGRLRPEKDHADSQTVDNRSQAGYGMSEMFTIVSSAPVDAPTEVITGSHGPVLPGNAVRVLAPDTGRPLGVGEEGELAVKGRTLMRGYLKLPPEATFDEDGFFHSGDTGYIGADGLVHWTGRSSDLIKTGGANVSPVELENVLLRHPDLAAAVAVGVPDPLLGERVVACATPRPGFEVTEDDVREFAAARLASYKVPRRVLFFSAAELPLTGTDKIQLAEVRTRATARLDAETVAS